MIKDTGCLLFKLKKKVLPGLGWNGEVALLEIFWNFDVRFFIYFLYVIHLRTLGIKQGYHHRNYFEQFFSLGFAII